MPRRAAGASEEVYRGNAVHLGHGVPILVPVWRQRLMSPPGCCRKLNRELWEGAMSSDVWDANEALRSELRVGEAVHWRGRPSITAALARENTLIWFAALAIAVGLRFCMPSVDSYLPPDMPKGVFGIISSVPFVTLFVVAVCCMVRTLLTTRRTEYVVTNLRIIIIRGGGRDRVTSVLPAEINASEISANSLGFGSLVFRSQIIDGGSLVEIGFWGIPDVRQVAKQIEALRGGSTAYPTP
jgi:hypothetical protein